MSYRSPSDTVVDEMKTLRRNEKHDDNVNLRRNEDWTTTKLIHHEVIKTTTMLNYDETKNTKSGTRREEQFSTGLRSSDDTKCNDRFCPLSDAILRSLVWIRDVIDGDERRLNFRNGCSIGDWAIKFRECAGLNEQWFSKNKNHNFDRTWPAWRHANQTRDLFLLLLRCYSKTLWLFLSKRLRFCVVNFLGYSFCRITAFLWGSRTWWLLITRASIPCTNRFTMRGRKWGKFVWLRPKSIHTWSLLGSDEDLSTKE